MFALLPDTLLLAIVSSDNTDGSDASPLSPNGRAGAQDMEREEDRPRCSAPAWLLTRSPPSGQFCLPGIGLAMLDVVRRLIEGGASQLPMTETMHEACRFTLLVLAVSPSAAGLMT
jgi:hypothetical protein